MSQRDEQRGEAIELAIRVTAAQMGAALSAQIYNAEFDLYFVTLGPHVAALSGRVTIEEMLQRLRALALIYDPEFPC